MKKTITSLIAILILLAVAGLAYYGFHFVKDRLAAQKAGQILSFDISKPDFLLTGKNLSRVEIWTVPAGANVTEENYSLLGNASLVTTTRSIQNWTFPIPQIPMLENEIFARAFDAQNQKVGDRPLPYTGQAQLYNALWGPATPENEITIWDNTRTFSFALGSKFGVKLDKEQYPEDGVSVTPSGIIESVSGVPATGSSFYVLEYQALKTGVCTVKNKDFEVSINVFDPESPNKEYSNPQFGISFDYPPNDILNPNITYQFVTDNSLVRIDLPRNDFMDTNLGEAVFVVGASSTSKVTGGCLEMFPTEMKEDNNEIINGINYKVFEGVGVGAGNIYETKSYRTLYNNVCYEAVLLLHYGNILNYSTGTVRWFDGNKALSDLTEILQTFNIRK
jgi:hypothetical protein